MKRKGKRQKDKIREVVDYDEVDMSESIGDQRPLKFSDIGLKLPETPPTQVVSIRVPTHLLNEIRAISSQNDVPYQGLIKMYLSEAVSREKKKRRA